VVLKLHAAVVFTTKGEEMGEFKKGKEDRVCVGGGLQKERIGEEKGDEKRCGEGTDWRGASFVHVKLLD
jgi:hypothetical protein